MPDLSGRRSSALDVLAAPKGATTIAALPPESRFVFRGAAEAADAAGRGFGVALPSAPCQAAVIGARAALWLGPDEWLLLAPQTDGPTLTAAITRALAAHPHALVDVSHRDVGIEIAGPQAETILNASCPLDLDQAAFPLGMCTRTVFARAGIVLWRTRATQFRVDVTRSFALYVWQMLEEARREYLG